VREFLVFLRQNIAWWLVPTVLLVVVLAAVVTLSGSALAPFLYP
jgi:hypothetical protein